MADSINIASSLGDYTVNWCHPSDEAYRAIFQQCRAAIVDKSVWDIYGRDPNTFGAINNLIIQEAREDLKTLETCISLCEQLLSSGFRRGEYLLAIGGGIIQDVATLTASVLFRGIPWIYVPTTLLAQADSCIGGKSSINLKQWKNQIGNFYPPKQIFIVPDYLKSLPEVELRSGLGEVLKVHLLAGPAMVQQIYDAAPHLLDDPAVMAQAVHRALMHKAQIIEDDEFDQGHRLILNYGHTFGHALEAATKFAVAHGVAVTLGADIANYVAWQLGHIQEQDYALMHEPLRRNLRPSDWVNFDHTDFFTALRQDKKNRPGQYCFILPVAVGAVERKYLPMAEETEQIIVRYFRGVTTWLQ
ncbi:MAG: 3-dehydroquinate synthase [Anaerolineae bacterium]|nr:3-dehydroquinate synthase [Anaerolineae bacterium]